MLRMLCLRGHARPRCGSGSLNPLSLQIGWNFAPYERAGARVLDANASSRNLGGWVEERDALPGSCAGLAPRDALRHDGVAVVIEGRERMQRIERLCRENVRVVRASVPTNLQHGADYLSALTSRLYCSS